MMSWLTDKFLFDVTVLVTSLQSATPRRRSQLANDMNHGNHLSLDFIGTKEGKEKQNKKKLSQRPVDQNKKKVS